MRKILFFIYLSLTTCCLSSDAKELELYLKTSPNAKEQIESIQAVNPKLNSQDGAVYKKVLELIDASPLEAAAVIEKIDLEKRSPIFDYILGVIYLQEENYQKSEQSFRVAVQKYPNFIKAHRALMKIYLKKEDFEKAKETVLKIVSLGGADGSLYGILAYIHYNSQNYSSALSAFQMARVYNEDRIEYKRGELFSYIGLKKYREVISLCEELIHTEKDQKQYWIEQMKAYRVLGETDKAIANLEILKDNNNLSVNETVLLAQLYFNEEMYDQSIPLFLSVLGQSKAELSTWTKPLNILIQIKKWTHAKTMMSSLEENFQKSELNENESYSMSKIHVLFFEEYKVEAEKQLRGHLLKWPTHGEALLSLARHLSEESNLSEAIFYYERAAMIEKVKIKSWRALGALFIEVGNYEKASLYLEKLNKVKPSETLKELLLRLRKRMVHE